jgi:hypothetical protein
MAEMIHFVRQLQAYCHLEVIECSWKALIDFLNKKEGDLDALIDAHRSYLDRMVKKVLLLSPKAGKEVSLHRYLIPNFLPNNALGKCPNTGQGLVCDNSPVPRSYGRARYLLFPDLR